MENRVLRFFQQPGGVYHASVFHQLSGGVGPCCLALDAQGNLYVGQYDVKGKQSFSCTLHQQLILFLLQTARRTALYTSFRRQERLWAISPRRGPKYPAWRWAGMSEQLAVLVAYFSTNNPLSLLYFYFVFLPVMACSTSLKSPLGPCRRPRS